MGVNKCRTLEVNGKIVIFLGSGDWTDTDRETFAQLVRAAKAKVTASAAPTPPSKPLAAQLAPPTRTSATEAQREDKS